MKWFLMPGVRQWFFSVVFVSVLLGFCLAGCGEQKTSALPTQTAQVATVPSEVHSGHDEHEHEEHVFGEGDHDEEECENCKIVKAQKYVSPDIQPADELALKVKVSLENLENITWSLFCDATGAKGVSIEVKRAMNELQVYVDAKLISSVKYEGTEMELLLEMHNDHNHLIVQVQKGKKRNVTVKSNGLGRHWGFVTSSEKAKVNGVEKVSVTAHHH